MSDETGDDAGQSGKFGGCSVSDDAPLGALGGLMLVGLFGLRRRD